MSAHAVLGGNPPCLKGGRPVGTELHAGGIQRGLWRGRVSQWCLDICDEARHLPAALKGFGKGQIRWPGARKHGGDLANILNGGCRSPQRRHERAVQQESDTAHDSVARQHENSRAAFGVKVKQI